MFIRLRYPAAKEMIFRDARKQGRLCFAGTTIRTVEDFAPEVYAERVKYQEVMAELYKQKCRPSLRFPAHLRNSLPIQTLGGLLLQRMRGNL